VKSVNRKIHDLEDNHVLQPFKWGSTKWYIEDETEDRLFEKVRQITEAFKYEELNEVQRNLCDKAMERTWLHGIDVFTNTVGLFIHHDKSNLKRLWHMWLGYFIQEASVGLTQMLVEGAIFEDENISDKQLTKELEKLPKWVKVFTRPRFEKYISDAIERSLKPEFKAQLEKARKKNKNASKNLAKTMQADGSKFT